MWKERERDEGFVFLSLSCSSTPSFPDPILCYIHIVVVLKERKES